MKTIYITERTIEKGTSEYKRFEALAKMLTAFSKNGKIYKVEDVYLDYGQDWMWTTITTETEWGGVQILDPRQWMNLMAAETSEELMEVYNDVVNDKYFIEN